MKNDELIWMREHSGLTQQGLAELFGVHRITVSNWETGKHPMPVRQFYALKKLLNVDITGMPRKIAYDKAGYPITPDSFGDDGTWGAAFDAALEEDKHAEDPRELALLRLEGGDYEERAMTRFRLAHPLPQAAPEDRDAAYAEHRVGLRAFIAANNK